MLDVETKRRIDNARDILVGKVPDPKSQVEQITIALIYKFMDDMDAQSEELGGTRRFFTKKFSPYSWAKLIRSGLSGHETLNLYAEAISKMPENQNLPALFRAIFKNAYLPYRDPETLRAFLKVIDEFQYDHSERLGDAFEYLLSVLGSQGDAGQFRTPRHIIDFMVAVIDPQKNESILDPACGTAGFLISAYKHILRANTDKKHDHPGSKLNPGEKKQLVANIRGYDISPDMVRLSLVNLYLHGFVEPHIFEYDTLTSEERWNEQATVILANPPFMTPKGGIRPHKRFMIRSNRSEVLFVDYMAEHLTPLGRAAIIVPEGIIFQSQKAYKQLRKMLMENYLVAVLSLPAGVFQPYSGVKTSILILDKSLTKRSGYLAFYRIKNDGYDLGAQRRKIEKNDLPQALTEIQQYFDRLRSGKDPRTLQSNLCLIVPKEKIAADGEYNLTAERYRKRKDYRNAKWPMVALGEVCELVRGVTYSKNDEVTGNGKKILRANNISLDGTVNLSEIKFISKELNSHQKLTKNDIFICLASGSKQHIGKVAFIQEETDFYCGGFMGCIRVKDNLYAKYLFSSLNSQNFNSYLKEQISGVNINNLSQKILYNFQIPLPPLEVQEQIVAEIDSYQKVVDGARQVVASYKPQIQIDPKWPMVALGEVCGDILSGGTPSTKISEYWNGHIPWITSADIVDIMTAKPRKFITLKAIQESATNLIKKGNIIVVTRVGLGKLFKNDFDVCISQDSQGLIVKRGINSDYLVYILKNEVKKFKETSQGSTIQGVTKKQLSKIQIPLPPLTVQEQIVSEIAKEQGLVDSNRELIAIFERKIADKIAGMWGS